MGIMVFNTVWKSFIGISTCVKVILVTSLPLLVVLSKAQISRGVCVQNPVCYSVNLCRLLVMPRKWVIRQ